MPEVSSPSRSSMLVGARLGAYELLRLIGRGATSSVFEGRHVVLGKRVAVKVLHEHLVNDVQLSARFLREGRVAARMHHDHVLEVIDLGREGDLAWLVMEYLEGEDLRGRLEHGVRLPLGEALDLLLPIASALAYAHGLGAVHRDIKPANVFLARDGRKRVVPKVVDFGLSKLDDLPESRPLTETDMVAGSVAYMAPEQTYGIGNAGPPADQFAFGCVLYECIVGHAPFRARTFFDLVEKVRGAKAPAPSGEVPSLPAAIDAIVRRAMAPEPDRRYPGMRALGADLLPYAEPATRETWNLDFVDPPPLRTSRPPASRSSTVPPVPAAVTVTAPHACPPLPRAAGQSPFQIRGMPYRGLAAFITRALPGGVAELCDALDDASLIDFLQQPFLASSTYDVLPIRPVMATLAHLLGRSFEELVVTTTRNQARFDGRTVLREMVGAVSLDDWHERAARFGEEYYTFGGIEGTRVGERHVILRHHGVPAYLEAWYGPMQAAYVDELARVLGGKNVRTERLPVEPWRPKDGLPTVVTGAHVHWE
jgi:serine/threonine protein kinase